LPGPVGVLEKATVVVDILRRAGLRPAGER
jgi:hypothetical protein